MNMRLGIIGCGNMGSAIAERVRLKYDVWVFDKDKDRTNVLSGVNTACSIIELYDEVNIIIFAVKPQDFADVLSQAKNYIKNKLVISIAAGITTKRIEECLGDVRVIRVMPNMPAKIGMGMSCLCRGKFASEKDLLLAKQLFDNLGQTLALGEEMMDAATAISGSGPGYFYDLIEGKDIKEIREFSRGVFVPALYEAAIGLGFNPAQAEKLANATTCGSLTVLEELNIAPAELKKQVISKGGTTEAGLAVLHQGGSLREAAEAALKRAKELSRKE